MDAVSKKTKIVATIGPVSDSKKTIEQLISAGVNVFRFNMKHNTVDWHEERAARVQSVADKLNVPVGILIDLQGPEIRIRTHKSKSIEAKRGDIFKLVKTEPGSYDEIKVTPVSSIDVLKAGDKILIDDGFVELNCTKIHAGMVYAAVQSSCKIENQKGMNLPGKELKLPSLIKADLDRLDIATRSKVDFVALSYTRTKKDISILRNEATKKKISCNIIAKIESQQGLDNIDEIISEADGIMIARGDLGLEVPIEEIVFWQKQIINKCRFANKPVIVATQMLQSMVSNVIPTRAEVTDVANAVLDGADALMLSAETASGSYPVKAAQTMSKIAIFNENNRVVDLKFQHHMLTQDDLVVNAGMELLRENTIFPVDAIIALSETGYTARSISSFRPGVPIYIVTSNQKTVETLTLSYATSAFKSSVDYKEKNLAKEAVNFLRSKRVIKKGQRILIIFGTSWSKPGKTNSLAIMKVN